MKSMFKRMLSLLLVLVMVGSMLPTVFAQEAADPNSESVELTDADYASADAIFAKIDKMEDAPATKNATEKELADQAAALVMASEGYVEGSLERNGNYFTWFTTEGVRCAYSPYMREKYANMKAPENAEPSGIYNEPKATKGGWPSGNQVYLIAPYYGIDDTFTDQYKNEAKAIATAIGDTDGYTLYSGTSVTVDNVAAAISNGAVVIFDSHGTTDYDGSYVCDDPDGYEVYDYVSNANYSYLCLTNKSGLTTADYNAGATYFYDSDGVMCACINGAAIANHMTKNSPAGLLWMAICLGMATDTFATSLRAKGVEVVYGYSQSVTFAGDYCFEETFWDNMIAGKDVATSIAAMKSKWGEWDWSEDIASAYGYSGSGYTLSEARKYRSAFPIVVSDEDAHPGQRKGSSYGADSQQTVKSTYTLYSQYSVTATSNNTAYGTVSASGSTITATPATGYFAQSATVTSGSATVSQDGNTFQVSANSDCTVQINFAPKTAVTVSFSGATVVSQNGYAGDAMTLPTNVTAPDGYEFLGWMASPLSADTTDKPTYHTGSFTPTGNTTLYALYSYVDENTSSGTGDYVKVTETPDDWTGEYLIVYEAGNLIFNGCLTSFDAVNNNVAVTISSNTIAAEDADAYKFVIAKSGSGYSIQGASGKYIGNASNSNSLTTSGSALVNTLSLDASGNANIVSSGGAYLRFNATSGQNRFRYYKSSSYSNQKAIALYVKDGAKGTTYYTTNPTKCEHLNTVNVDAVAATCTEGGFTAGVQCVDCQVFISGHEVVTALGHSWSSWNVTTAPTCDAAGEQIRTCAACGQTENQSIAAQGHSYSGVVTPPTATEQGYTTYTCGNCGHSYVGDYVEALGQTYTVSFSVPEGVTAVDDMLCGKAGITLPVAEAPDGYTFVGWVTAMTDDTETQPETYEAGNILTTNANVTLFALYSYVVGGTGVTEYVLTDIADISASDEVVVTVTYTDGTVYALYNANGTSSAPTATTVTVSDNKLSGVPAAELLWNIGGSEGAYIFYPNGTTATWLYCTGTNNGVRVGTNSAKTFAIDSASGYLKHNGTSRYLGVYRTNPDWRCYTNTTGNIANQTLGFYVKSAGGTTYYTTIGTAEETVAAVYSGSTMQKAYATFEEAVAACGEGQYVKLLADVEAETILEKDLLLDLNGYDLTGLLEPDGYQVSCFDSTNEASGIFNCTDIEDQVVVPVTLLQLTVNGVDSYYMSIAGDNGYSFHYFSFSITHMSLKPAYTAVGYKAVFNGDDAVIAMLNAEQAFGYTLSLENGGSVSRWLTVDKLSSGKPVTLRLQNYDVENYGEAALSAYVSIKIGNTEIKSDVQTITLRSMVETINDTYQQYTQEQLEAVRELINAHEIMKSWEVADILEYQIRIDTVNEIYSLAAGATMENVTLKGTITSIYTAYNETYGNITVIITIAGAADKPIKCYRMEGNGAADLRVGDVITVTGTVTHYVHTSSGDSDFQFAAGCTFTK